MVTEMACICVVGGACVVVTVGLTHLCLLLEQEYAEVIIKSLQEAVALTCPCCKKNPHLSLALSRAIENAERMIRKSPYKRKRRESKTVLRSEDWENLV